MVASVLRKPPEVLSAFFHCLQWQQFRQPGADLRYSFIANFADADPFRDAAMKVVTDAFGTASNWHCAVVPAPAGDYGDTDKTRMWSQSSFGRMAELKNRLLQEALTAGVDFIFLIDADVLIDPWTVQALLDSEAPIVSAVYWTNWHRATPGSTEFVHAGPQVWLRHPYFLDDERYTEAEFRDALIRRSRIQVRGLGACTLINVAALKAGVHFGHVDALPPGPMSEGEDRHFCARAQRAHVGMYADAWPDVYHAYHPAEYGDIPAMVARLGRKPLERPRVGDLVSLKLEILEPVPDAFGRMFMVGPKFVRGRLGCLPLLPQLENTAADLTVGASRITRVMYPAGYPLDFLRNQTRLFKVTLLDAKPYSFAPVIECELLQGGSGAFLDSTNFTATQVAEMVVDATEVPA